MNDSTCYHLEAGDTIKNLRSGQVLTFESYTTPAQQFAYARDRDGYLRCCYVSDLRPIKEKKGGTDQHASAAS